MIKSPTRLRPSSGTATEDRRGRQTTVSLPLEHVNKLQEIAAREKRSVSFLIAEAVAAFLQQREQAA